MAVGTVGRVPTIDDPASFCFGCHPEHPGGLHLATEVLDGRAHSLFRPTAGHQGPPGLVHGGLIACALDDVMATLVHATRPGRHVTASLTVRYRAPVAVGAVHDIEAEITEVDGRKVHVRGRMLTDGVLAAEAEGLLIRTED